MKSKNTRRPFPTTKAEWQDVVADAPKRVTHDPETDPYDPNDRKAVKAFWSGDPVVKVHGGGIEAVRNAVAKRRQGQRGPQRAPTKTLVSLRLSQEVLDHFKSFGKGWQTRIDDMLKTVIAAKQHRG